MTDRRRARRAPSDPGASEKRGKNACVPVNLHANRRRRPGSWHRRKGLWSVGRAGISSAASLDGGLGLDLLSGFSLAVGDKFDVLSFSSLSGGFDALSLDGGVCAAQTADVWRCYAQSQSWYLTETIGGSGLYQQYVSVTGEAPAPEPSTMALLAMGFASLAGWRWKMRAGARGARALCKAEKGGAGPDSV